MSISERARVKLAEIPETEKPISELYRISAIAWVDAEKAASLLEELKSATLSQMILEQGDIAVNRAETRVKASDKWREYIAAMVEARSKANHAKVRLEYYRMLHSEDLCKGAAERVERRMSR